MIFNISPFLYPLIFFLFLCILVIGQSFVLSNDGSRIKPENKSVSLIKAWVLIIAVTLFVGFRPVHVIFTDTINYARHYENIFYEGAEIRENNEPLWNFIMQWFANNGFEVNYWFAFICFMDMILIALYCKNLMPKHLVLLMIFCMTGFSFFSGLVNGIRNTFAIYVFIFGFSIYFVKPDSKTFLLSLLIGIPAYLIHNSIIILLIAYLASVFFVKNTKFALFIWFGAIIITLIFGPSLAETVSIVSENERAMDYLNEGLEGIQGNDLISKFRFDFLLYSSVPVILGWYVTIKKKIQNQGYQLLLNTYIISNAIWIVFMYAAYTNRFASLSWSLFGVVVCFPLVKFSIWGQKRSRNIILFLWGQLAFYAFMLFK